MRKLAVVCAMGAGVVCCSSEGEDKAVSCEIAGTYAMTATAESAPCESDPDAGAQAVAAGGSNITVVTISPPSRAGAPYMVRLQGATGGGCGGELLSACKLQTVCEFTQTDSTDPSNATGTIQFSWTFSAVGFSGLNSLSLPPGPLYPKGCRGTATAKGERR